MKLYSLIVVLLEIVKIAAELKESELPVNSTALEPPHEDVRITTGPRTFDIISINLAEASGPRLDTVSSDLHEAIRNNQAVNATAQGRIIECWKSSLTSSILVIECGIEDFSHVVRIELVPRSSSPRRLETCENGLVWITDHCESCGSGKGSMDSGLTCSTLQCDAVCATCIDKPSRCESCADTLHFAAGAPGPGECSSFCPNLCLNCIENSSCTVCEGQLEWISTSCRCRDGTFMTSEYNCYQCHSSCLTCSSANVCTQCRSCWHFSVPNASSGVCSYRCPKHCKTCDADTQCGVCHDGYYRGDDLLCYKCDITCSTCVSASTSCLTCGSDYHPTYHGISMPQSCTKACPINCEECSESDWCTSCTPEWSVDGSGGCQCTGNVYLSGSACTNCPTGCDGCNTSADCIACKTDYHPTTFGGLPGICTQECPPNCDECDYQDHCSTCKGGLFWETNSCVCADGQYLDISKCVACPASCVKCSDAMTCLECKPCWHFMGKNDTSGVCSKWCPQHCKRCSCDTECEVCMNGYYLNGVVCYACTTPCLTCSASDTYCESCVDGYVKSGNGGCTQSPPTCATAPNCPPCVAPYTDDGNGGCTQSPPTCATAPGTHCLSCDMNQCTSCDSTQFHTVSNSFDCVCTPGDNCSECSAEGCNTCTSSEFAISNGSFDCTCVPGDHCAECESLGCAVCSVGWHAVPGSMSCTYDLTAPGSYCLATSETQCTLCDSADFHTVPNSFDCECTPGSQCEACSETGCTTCSDSAHFIASPGSFSCMCSLGSHCSTCSETGCTSCEDNLIWQTQSGSFDCICIPGHKCNHCNGTACDTCFDSNWTPSTNFDCECIPGVMCETCGNSGCLQCANDNWETSQGSFDCRCIPGDHCSSCDSSGCTSCSDSNFVTVPGSYDCQCKKGVHCSTCSSTGCTACDSPNWHVVSGSIDCQCTLGAHCEACNDTGCTTCDSSDWTPSPGSFSCSCVPGDNCESCLDSQCVSCISSAWQTQVGSLDCICKPGAHCSHCAGTVCNACAENFHTVNNSLDCECDLGTHCQSCDETGCLECDSPGWETITGSFGCQCIPGNHCLECSSTLCSTCESGYASIQGSFNCRSLAGNHCSQANNNACITCDGPQWQTVENSFDCVSAPGDYCKAASNGECTECINSSYSLIPGSLDCQCIPGLHCSSCDGVICSACLTHFTPITGSFDCECLVGTHCQACNAEGCTQCVSADWMTVSGGFDCACVKGLHCVSCNDEGCQSCEQGWHTVSGQMNCSKDTCVPGTLCSQCDDTGCLDCPSNAYPVPNTFDCQYCGAHCAKCTSTGCQTCDDPANYEPKPDSSQCWVICKGNQYRFGDQCMNCDVSCSACPDITQCTSCSQGYLPRAEPGLCYADLQCEAGEWNKLGVCSPCDVSCSLCHDQTSCDSCKSGYDSQGSGKLCLLSCAVYQFRDSQTLQCTNCPKQCSTCSSQSTCLTCSNGYYPGVNSGECPACDSSCSLCLNSATNCVACKANYYQVGALPGLCTSTCHPSCTDCSVSYNNCLNCSPGYYSSTTSGECLPCSSECGTCATTPSNCLSCATDYFPASVFPGTCTNVCAKTCSTCKSSPQNCLTCAAGYYSPSLPSPCVACHMSCKTCSGSATNCLLCVSSYLPVSTLPGICQTCDVSCLTCQDSVTTCVEVSSGYYFIDTQPGPASPCDTSCKECTKSATNCSTCATTFFPGVNLPGTCTRICDASCTTCSVSAILCNSCQIGYFAATDFPASCIKCADSCSTCSTSATQCKVCASGYISLDSLPGECTNQCDTTCESCSGSARTCTICSHNYLPVTSLPGNCSSTCDVSCQTCQDTVSICSVCAEGYFAVGTLPGACTNICNPSCNGCSVSATNCNACAEGYFPYSLTSKKCVAKGACSPTCLDSSSCPDAYTSCVSCSSGYSKQNGLCVSIECYEGCATCVGSAYTDCVSCKDTYTYLPALQVCQASSCSQSCATCYGLGADQCLTCKANSSKNPGTDLCTCAMYYTYEPVSKNCLFTGTCSGSCLTCSGPYDNNCLTCRSNAVLVVADQVCECVPGYTWNSESTACIYSGTCHSFCATCSGPAATECLSCPLHATLSSSSCNCDSNYTWATSRCQYTGPCHATCGNCTGPGASECSSCKDSKAILSGSVCTCPGDYTWNSGLRICEYTGPCPMPYSSCSSPTQGTICDPNANSVCAECNVGYIWDQNLNRCSKVNCHASCLKCYGPLSTNCLSCNTALNHSLTSTNTCECRTGYFGTVSTQTSSCSKCHPTCLTCTSSASNSCLSCVDSATKTDSNTCQPKTGYYWDTQQEAFKPCDSTCLACSGTALDCTACQASFILVSSRCKCVAGTLLDSTSNVCKPCSPACSTCFGFNSNQCSSCANDQNLVSNACVCKTENMYNDNGTCTPCYDGCKSCSGPSSSECLTCYSPAILSGSKTPTSCICINPLKPAPTPKLCKQCPSTCADCSISDDSKCTSCKSNAHLNGFSPAPCVCDNGYYLNPSGQVCSPCHKTCGTCSGPGPSSCLTCNGVAMLGKLYCATNCPVGYTVNNGECKLTTQVVYQQPFNTLQWPVIDLKNKYKSLFSGESPKTLYDQGLQMSGTEQVILPSNSADSRELTLGPSFSIEAWVRPSLTVDTGNKEYFLLSKAMDSQYLLLGLSILNNELSLHVLAYPSTASVSSTKSLYQSSDAKEVTVSGGKVPTGQTWTVLRATVETTVNSNNVPTIVLTLYIDGVKVTTKSEPGYFFQDFTKSDGSVSFVVGAKDLTGKSANYQGGFAELAINAGIQPTSPVSCSCSKCTASGVCLISCLPTQYLKNGKCSTCPNQCLSTGCLQPNDCTMSLDPLCATPADFGICSACKPLAEFDQSSQCKCVANASYNSDTTSCSCSDTYKQSDNTCVACRSYYTPEELTLTVNVGYSGFTITFARLLVITNLNSCADMFTEETVKLFGTKPTCVTLQNQKIVVDFGSDYVPEDHIFYVNFLTVTASKGACNYLPQSLPVHITVMKPDPPIAILTAPLSYSIACSGTGSGLVLSGRNSKQSVAGNLSYEWELQTEQGELTSAYKQFSRSQDLIILPDSMLFSSTLRITLSVKDKYNTSVATGTVTITKQVTLGVVFDCGNTLSLPTTAGQRVTASVIQKCDSSARQYTYKWSLTTDATADSDVQTGISSVINTAQDSAIRILESALPPGTYQLKCIVTDQSGSQGSGILALTITSSALVPSCDKAGAPVTPSQKIAVDCQASYDPDQINVKPSGRWLCELKSGGNCKNKNGAALVFNSAGLILSVSGSEMEPNLTYIFTLTISKGKRSASLPLTFPITGIEGTEVTVSSGPRHSNQRPFKVDISITQTTTSQTSVTADDPANLMAQSANVHILPLTVINPPTLGGSFTMTITLRLDVYTTLIDYLAAINAPPTPGLFLVTPAYGTALSTDFTFTASGQQDRDGPDLPITNNFGYVNPSGQKKLFSIPTASNSASRKLSTATQSLFNKVCDSGDSCDYAYASAAVTRNKRELQSTDVPAIFDELSVDQDSTFTAAIMLSYDLDFTTSDWQYVFNRLTTYASGFSSINANQLMAEITAFEALISMQAHQTQENLGKIIAALNSITSQYLDGSYDQVFRRQLQAVQQYQMTSLDELLMVDAYFNLIESAYVTMNYPGQPFISEGTAESLSINFMQRITAPTLESSTFESNLFKMTFPTSVRPELKINDDEVLNLWVKIYKMKDYPVGLLSAKLEKSGVYGNYTWQDLDTMVDCPLLDLQDSINLTLPVFNVSQLARGAQCIEWQDGRVINLDCTILEVTNTTITISTRSVPYMTVVGKEVNFAAGQQLPFASIPSEECDRYYAPAFIMAALVSISLILGLGVGLWKRSSYSVKSEYIPESEQSLNSFREVQPVESQLFEVPPERSLFNTEDNGIHNIIGPENTSELFIRLPDRRSELEDIAIKVGSSSNLNPPGQESAFRVDVPPERSEPSSKGSALRVDVPPERSEPSSKGSALRVDVPPEHSPSSSKDSGLRIDVLSEHSVSASFIEVPPERSILDSSESHNFKVADEHLHREQSEAVPRLGLPVPAERSYQASEGDVSDRQPSPRPSAPERRRIHKNRASKKSAVEAVEGDSQELTFTEVLSGHYLLGLLLCHRGINLLLLLVTLLNELFFLGVFYYFLADSHSQGQETTMGYFFTSYDSEDVKYYVWAVVITFVLSLILTTLSTPVWARTLKSRSLAQSGIWVICVSLVVLYIILIVLLDLAVCYEFSGRWTVGFLWAVVTEVLVAEFIVAVYRWLLMKFLRAK